MIWRKGRVTATMFDGALSDVKVLDFTHYVAGPYCTKLLADYGADVVKVERPDGGDGARRLGPFPKDEPHPEKSGLFLHLNTNKRGISLNLKTPESQRIIKQLVKNVDIVVESFRPGTMAKFGLDYESLKSVNPDLVMTSISNFGQTGPYRDYKASDVIIYGMGGEMYSTGIEGREPLKLGDNVVLYQAGAVAATATMGALFAAKGQGIGQNIDVSIMETQVGSIDRRMSMILAYHYNGEITRREPYGSGIGYPSGVYLCADGYIQINGGGSYFPRVIEMLGEPEFLQEPKWRIIENQYNHDMKMEFEEYFIPWCLERSKQEVWHAAQKSRVLTAPLNTIEDLLADPHFNERGAFAEVEHPKAGTLTIPGRPFIMNETPWTIRRAAPLLGEHTAEVLEKLGYGEDEVKQMRKLGFI